MSDTPRTNEQTFDIIVKRGDAKLGWINYPDGLGDFVESDFCKQLERELNAANERIQNLKSALCTVENIDKVNAYQDLESANERIKRLEEAGNAMCKEFAAFCPLGSKTRDKWRKAKEAKP